MGPTAVDTRGVARGAVITVALQAVRFVTQVAGLVVLARLVVPADFGLIALVAAVVGVGEILRDFGLSAAALQVDELTHATASNLFWVNSALGVVLAGVLAACGPLLAAVYGHPELIGLTAVVACQFFFSGPQTQFQVQLGRAHRFATLAVTDLAAQVAAITIAVAAAMAGAGVWALAAQLVGLQAFLLALRVGSARWWPSWPGGGAPLRPFFRYSGNLAATQLLVYSSRSVDALLIGAVAGPRQLGIYTRAQQLVLLPLHQVLSPLTNVALPVLARLRHNRQRFSSLIGELNALAVLVVALVLGASAACAADAIPLVLGQEWAGAGLVFQILSVGGLFQAGGYVAYWVFLAEGKTGAHLRYSVWSRTIIVLGLVAGSRAGMHGVAVAYAVGAALAWPLAWLMLAREVAVPLRRVLTDGGCVIAATATAAVSAILLGSVAFPGNEPSWGRAALVVVLFLMLGAAMVRCLPAGRRAVRSARRWSGSGGGPAHA